MAKKLTKKQIEQIAAYKELLDDMIKVESENKEQYYLPTGYRKQLAALNTACARATVEIAEDQEWNKYGCSIVGRSVVKADVAKVIPVIQSIIDEVEAVGGVKRSWASTTRGETSYARSAVGVFISARSGESYRDAADRMTRYVNNR